MPRFFVPSTQLDLDGGTLYLTGDDAHHIARSLRMAVGDTITVCDMHGTAHTCHLTQIRDDRVDAAILESAPDTTEPPCFIHLYMAYPKGDKLETVIQKAVELGASRITPFESERCVKRPDPSKWGKLQERFGRIALEAAKQCGRARLPQVDTPIPFSQVLQEGATYDLPLFCYEGDDTVSLKAIFEAHPSPRTICVVVGAEGGFSLKEAELARLGGFQMANLGARILRCETAPTYALSAISYAYELKHSEFF